jgi:hypothetical protein
LTRLPDPRPSDAFDELGRQVAGVLRAANDEASRVRADAEGEAEAIRAQARVQAEALRAEAEQDRDEAKRLLVRARERADQTVAEGEHRANQVVADAEHQARSRVEAVLDTGRARLERLAVEERMSRDRLLEAQADLQSVIQRISRPTPVIDLTRTEATIRFGMRGAQGLGEFDAGPVVPAMPSMERDEPHRFAADAAADVDDREPPADPDDRHATRRADPLTTMVRSAVDRAVASAGREEPIVPRPPERRPPGSIVRRKRPRSRLPGDPLPPSGAPPERPSAPPPNRRPPDIPGVS